MSERERWIVYPLLFLALGAALRDKLVDRTTAKSIVCQELTIVDEECPISNPANVGANWTIEPKAGGTSLRRMRIDGDLDRRGRRMSTSPDGYQLGRTRCRLPRSLRPGCEGKAS